MKRGFTLAEVLVTLGIIGVVSAMTIPTLMRNHQRQVYVTRLHKVYNIMTEGFALLMQETNAVDIRESLMSQGHAADVPEIFLKSHFKIAMDCGLESSKCFADKYKSLNGREASSTFLEEDYGDMYSVSLSDGTSVALSISANASKALAERYGIGHVYVDTNGKEGPNVAGRDFFRMYIYPDGVIDDYLVGLKCRKEGVCDGASSPQERRQKNFDQYCMWPEDTDGCFGRILNDGWKMNY